MITWLFAKFIAKNIMHNSNNPLHKIVPWWLTAILLWFFLLPLTNKAKVELTNNICEALRKE